MATRAGATSCWEEPPERFRAGSTGRPYHNVAQKPSTYVRRSGDQGRGWPAEFLERHGCQRARSDDVRDEDVDETGASRTDDRFGLARPDGDPDAPSNSSQLVSADPEQPLLRLVWDRVPACIEQPSRDIAGRTPQRRLAHGEDRRRLRLALRPGADTDECRGRIVPARQRRSNRLVCEQRLPQFAGWHRG